MTRSLTRTRNFTNVKSTKNILANTTKFFRVMQKDNPCLILPIGINQHIKYKEYSIQKNYTSIHHIERLHLKSHQKIIPINVTNRGGNESTESPLYQKTKMITNSIFNTWHIKQHLSMFGRSPKLIFQSKPNILLKLVRTSLLPTCDHKLPFYSYNFHKKVNVYISLNVISTVSWRVLFQSYFWIPAYLLHIILLNS